MAAVSGPNIATTRGASLFAPRRRRLAGLLLLVLIIASVLWVAILQPTRTFENPGLITALNLICITLSSLLVSVIAARSYLAAGATYMVWIGAASLLFGISPVVGATLLAEGANAGITVQNVGAFAAAVCHALAAVLAIRPRSERRGLPWTVVAVYGSALAFIGLLTLAAMGGATPAFITANQDFTALRQAVLAVASVLFFVAAIMYATLFVRIGSDFLYWYCLSLGAIAIGLVAVLLETDVGALLSWIGRTAQQIGGLYLLIAVLVAVREAHSRRISIAEALSGFFRDPLAGYQLVFDAAFQAIVSTDQAGRVELWNPAASRIFGYSSAEAIGRALGSLVVPPWCEDFVKPRLAALGSLRQDVVTGEPADVQCTRRGGEVFPATFAFCARRTEAGWFTVILIADASREKRAEAERERLLAELQTALASMPAGVEVYDRAGKIVRANARAREMLGYTEETLSLPAAERARRVYAEAAEDGRAPIEDLPPARVMRGERFEGLITHVHPPGRPAIWLSASGTPILTEDGSQVGAVLVHTDVSALRELQERREQLIEAISHDLRSPLTTILAMSQLLLRNAASKGLAPDITRGAAAIEQSAKRMRAMIEDLVESVYVEAGRLSLRPGPVDLRQLVVDLCERLSGPYADARLKVEVEEGLPPVLADAERLERAITNLVTNGLKYSAPGTPVVVRLECRDGRAVVAVSDRGQGIEAEDLPHVFERHFRAQASREREGLGLGLYICRQIVEAHGGEVRVESEVGKGSTFYVTLPLAQ